MAFKDHFSGHAAEYARARPGYPRALFDFLAEQCSAQRLAWDCACGNGQAARSLRSHFDAVIATDGSFEQLSQRTSKAGLLYCQVEAETRILAPGCVDLVCVAQALHWFDLAAFYDNVSVVLRPGGVLAAWCYGLHRITPQVDAVIEHFYQSVVGRHWPPERVLVENGYRDLDFPFQELDAPQFEMRCDWTAHEVLAYLASWSAVRRYMKETGVDPVAELAPALLQAWGDAVRHSVTWPLSMRLGTLMGARGD